MDTNGGATPRLEGDDAVEGVTGVGDAHDVLVAPTVGRGPGVLVIHSGRGLTPFVEALCSRLADHGFVGMAVDLFDGARPTTAEAARKAKDELDDRRGQLVLENAVTFLRGYESVSRSRIGVLGLGYGSGWACWLASALPETVAAAILFYGYRDVSWGDAEAAVIGHFAELDRSLPPSRVDQLRERLVSNGVSTDFFVYPGTEPSFFEPDRTAQYAPEAADLAWERTRAFLRGTLQQG